MENHLLVLTEDTFYGYIKLPPSILRYNIDNNISHPYYYVVESDDNKYFFGVLEFSSDDDTIIIPEMIYNKYFYNIDIVTAKYIDNIPKGDFVELEPQEEEIYKLDNLRKILEYNISKYCILFNNQIIYIKHDEQIFSIKINKVMSRKNRKTNIIDVVNTNIDIQIKNIFYKEEQTIEEQTIEEQTIEEQTIKEQDKGQVLSDENVIRTKDEINEIRNQKLGI